MTTYTENELAAVVEYLARGAGLSKPEGRWDNAGRFFPSDKEDADGDLTKRIRTPSRAWPRSYYTAAKTLRHVCLLFEVEEDRVRKLARDVKKAPWLNRSELEAWVLRLTTESAKGPSKSRRL